jgi:acetyltransferase-like isoleucine patch superfamily enzyme
MEDFARIGSLNYITGYPGHLTDFFGHINNRKCELYIGTHSAITSRHFVDCTCGIQIGSFTTIAGIRSQFLTHSIDLVENRQSGDSIKVGDYCFIGTNCVFLPGSQMPSFSILGAKSVLNKALTEGSCLYGGVPVKKIKEVNKGEIAYFQRKVGSVN